MVGHLEVSGDGDAHANADGAHRDAKAGDERLEQHVAGAELGGDIRAARGAASGGVHAGNAFRGGRIGAKAAKQAAEKVE